VPSVVGEVVGNIVGVSETAKVGVGGSGVMVIWLMVKLSVVSRDGGSKSPFSGDKNGKLPLACRRGQAINVRMKILMVSSSARLRGLIRMLRLVLPLRLGERFVSSDTLEPGVIRSVLQEGNIPFSNPKEYFIKILHLLL
jgi:hypothetical protein